MGINTGGQRLRSIAESSRRLLQSPFDFTQAFDQALKDIVGSLPNRPANESSDDAVSQNLDRKNSNKLKDFLGILLRLHWKLRRILL